MKEELITYETALLAKKKGFKSKIDLGYKYNTGNYYNENGILNGDVTKYIKARIKDKNISNTSIAVPTQSLLQKWLREKYNIHVETFFDKTYSATITKNGKWYNSAIDYNTYEKALEKGLQEALKLIKT